ncbi:glycosyltransferase [Planctomycetota bacterium]|nr:glycosyltransferase [Planctomycetota bacterium]
MIRAVRAKPYDLVLMSKVETFDYELIEILNSYSKTFYYFVDPMAVSLLIDAPEYARRATYSSATFSDVTLQFRSFGAQASQIVQGVDEANIRRPSSPVRDIVFAGNMTRERHQVLQHLSSVGAQVEVFGHGSPNGPIYLDRLINEYACSRIALNLVRPGSGFSVRIFEVMASGTLLLTQYCSDLELFFERGREIDWFHDYGELERKIEFYLREEELRLSMVERARKRVVRDFTWLSQAKQILDWAQIRQ